MSLKYDLIDKRFLFMPLNYDLNDKRFLFMSLIYDLNDKFGACSHEHRLYGLWCFLGANKSSSVWACTKSFMFYTLCHTGTLYMQQTSWNLIFKKFVCSSSTKNLEKSPSILSHAWFSTSSWTCFDLKFIFDIHLIMSMRKSMWNKRLQADRIQQCNKSS